MVSSVKFLWFLYGSKGSSKRRTIQRTSAEYNFILIIQNFFLNQYLHFVFDIL